MLLDQFNEEEDIKYINEKKINQFIYQYNYSVKFLKIHHY